MELFDKKTVMTLGVIAALATWAWSLQKNWNGIQPVVELNDSYEMIRPKAYTAEDELAARTLNRQITDLRNQTKPAAAALAIPPVAAVDKKAAAEAQKKKQEAAKVASLKAQAQLGVRVVDTSRSSDGGLGRKDSDSSANPTFVRSAVLNMDGGVQTKKDDKKEKSQTSQEWVQTLLGSPNMVTAGRFLEAYRKGEVTDSDFYSATEALLTDSSIEKQKVALMLFQGVPSIRTFEVMVGYMNKQSDSQKAAIQSAVMNPYGEPARFGVLNQALLFSAEPVALEAARVLGVAVDRAQGGVSTGRGRGNAGGSDITWSDLAFFIPTLEKIIKTEGSNAAWAQALLQQIQSSQTAVAEDATGLEVGAG